MTVMMPENVSATTVTAENVHVECTIPDGNASLNEALCGVTAGYSDGTFQTTYIKMDGKTPQPLPGVESIVGINRLKGYLPDISCAGSRYSDPASKCVTVYLKDKPVSQTTQIYSVPGTGLPDGLNALGMAAIGLSMIGVLVACVRRRS